MPEVKKDNIKRAVIRTVCYFDIFEYPLTLAEIWFFLFCPQSEAQSFLLIQVKDAVDSLVPHTLERAGEFYFLKGREGNVKKRKERYKLAIGKYKKTKRILRCLSVFPFVRMIAVCNSLSISNSRPESDIDIFVVCKKNKIWTVRFMVTFFLKIFRRRPLPKNTKDKICPSFFITDDNLNLRPYRLNENDIYMIYWIATIAPIYAGRKIRGKFYKSNAWVKNFLPNAVYNRPCPGRSVVLGKITKKIKKTLEAICGGAWMENFLKNFQHKNFSKTIKEMMNKDTRVVVNDKILKFHSIDKREEYYRLYNNKLKNFLDS